MRSHSGILKPRRAHPQAAKQAKKDKKSAKASAAAGSAPAEEGDGDWEANHPWRPFDRDRDLGNQVMPQSKEALLKKTGNLTSRFQGTAEGGRSFL